MATKQRKAIETFHDDSKASDEDVKQIMQVLDDQTPIDDAAKRTKKDDLQGFDKRLPSGNEREIRVDRSRLGGKNPIMVISAGDGRLVGTYDEIKIEGESEIVHQLERNCEIAGDEITGSVSVRTSASILVKKTKVKK